MHGIVLKSLGHDVHILEAREPQEMEAETAGLSLTVEAQQLMKAYLPEVKDYAIPPAPAIQVVDTHGETLIELPINFPSITSTWGVVFQHLRDRFLDWIWYDGCDISSEEFEDVMTNRDRRRRRNTVPRGQISPTVWRIRLETARVLVGQDWLSVISETKLPFVTNITNLQSSKACFFMANCYLWASHLLNLDRMLG